MQPFFLVVMGKLFQFWKGIIGTRLEKNLEQTLQSNVLSDRITFGMIRFRDKFNSRDNILSKAMTLPLMSRLILSVPIHARTPNMPFHTCQNSKHFQNVTFGFPKKGTQITKFGTGKNNIRFGLHAWGIVQKKSTWFQRFFVVRLLAKIFCELGANYTYVRL